MTTHGGRFGVLPLALIRWNRLRFSPQKSFGRQWSGSSFQAEMASRPLHKPSSRIPALESRFFVLSRALTRKECMSARKRDLKEWEIDLVYSSNVAVKEMEVACGSLPTLLWQTFTRISKEAVCLEKLLVWNEASFVLFSTYPSAASMRRSAFCSSEI